MRMGTTVLSRRVSLVVSLWVLGAIASPAQAFCGFFVAGSNAKLTNSATQVALLRSGDTTVMTLSNNYQGPPESFALVVPVPVVLHKKDVKTLPPNVFDHLDALSAPRLVEYWEQDPCRILPPPSAAEPSGSVASMTERRRDRGVTVEARFTVGEYQILILSAKDSSGLERWLRANHYHIPEGAAAALAPYVRAKSKFFVAKVDIDKVHRDAQGVVVLSPLRFGYPQPTLRLPVRLGLLNAQGPQDLIVYVLSPKSRYEAANYANATIATNLEVTDRVRGDFAAFYAKLFDATLAEHRERAVVTEYAWETTSCDPCPTAPLGPEDIATLGGDMLAQRYDNVSWVLTRMHTRYDRSTLGEDLVFRQATPIEGGREWGNPGIDAASSGINNFQARYIIRHRWRGRVTCQNPRRGIWGGPPNGAANLPAVARHLASAPRANIDLGSVVKTKVPALGLPGHAERNQQ